MRAVFLDANILLDILDFNRKNHLKSKEILKKLLVNGYRLGISEDMISNIYYVAKRAKVDEIKLLEFLEFWLKHSEVLHFGDETIQEAIFYCKERKNSDLEDVMQAFCAKKNEFDSILSEDIDFIKDILRVQNLLDIEKDL